MPKKPPNHTIADAADASLNVAMVLIDNTHFYSDEVFIREMHSRGYIIIPSKEKIVEALTKAEREN